MTKTLCLLACFGFILCTASKCDKDMPIIPEEEKLPPFTTTGVEKLGCLINGKAWVTGAPYFLSDPNTLFNVDTLNNNIGILARKKSDQKRLLFSARIIDSFKLGEFKIEYNKWIYEDRIEPSICPDYELDTTKPNSISIIFIDKQKKIVSGEFKFTAINRKCNDTAVITNGLFDLNFRFN